MRGLINLHRAVFFLILTVSVFTSFAFAQELGEKDLGKFRNTYYYVVLESEYAKHEKNVDVLDFEGNVLAKVSKAFKDAMDIEGTGRLMDGRILNFDGVKNREIRYRFTKNQYGDGSGACALVPFHTIAADPKFIPAGALVFIKKTVGMVLPNGEVHNGLWRADDVGGAIKKDRVDLFVGDGDAGEVLTRHGITHMMALEIELVEAPTPDSCVKKSPGDSY